MNEAREFTFPQKVAIFVVLNIGWMVMGYSRLILGMHSLNQIIYGGFMGLLTCAFCIKVIGPIVAAEIFDLKTSRKTNMIAVYVLTLAMNILICVPAVIVGDLFNLPEAQL